MGAARYVGRVGGLAVALGIGTAVFLGAGTASADTETSTDTNTAPAAGVGTSTATDTTGVTKPDRPKFTLKLPRLSDLAPHRPSATDAKSDSTSTSKSVVTSSDSATQVSATQVVRRGHTRLAEKAAEARAAVEKAVDDGEKVVERTLNAAGSTNVASRLLAPVQVAKSTTSLAGTTPPPATPDTPVTALLAGAARRELGADRLTYNPDIDVVNGVITGTPAASTNLTYTAVGTPTGGAKVYVDKTTGKFAYLPYSDAVDPNTSQAFDDQVQTFNVLVAQDTIFVRALADLPVIGGLVQPIVVRLHQVPIVNDILSPIIGRSQVFTVEVIAADEAADGGVPIAFTTTVVSFDTTPISVNWFPANGLEFGDTAPTILNGPSLATAGYIDPDQQTTVFGLVPGLDQLRDGYNVVTWDPRGEYASGGVLQLDSPHYEAKDVSAIITWVTQQKATQFDGQTQYVPGTTSTPDGTVNNPRIGMVGGSYGGGIQLTSAGIDKRIDAIAPGIAWNNLYTTLYPNEGFKTSFATLLLLSLVASGSRINPTIYSGIVTGAVLGILTPGQKEFLEENSPSLVVDDITAPTMFLQGTVDVLFPLQQALTNAQQIGTADGVVKPPVRMIWYCGGHGQCLDPVDQDKQTAWLATQTMAWMDTYVKYQPGDEMSDGEEPPVIPKFQWVDQTGILWSAENLPLDSAFYAGQAPIVSETGHGVLGIVPVLGGSGPSPRAGFPVSLATASPALNAIRVDIPNPTNDQQPVAHVVGSPTLTMTYSGVGTSRHVYAQIVDKKTGRVVGNILTPIEVTLDGKEHTTKPISMENIAYTMRPGDELELQIVGSATPFENFTSYGVIDVHDVSVELPRANSGAITERDSFHTTKPPKQAGTLLGI